jgi:hypothetical protein
VAWRYVRRYAEPLLAKLPNESELRVDLVDGSMILYSADNDGRSSQVLHGQAFAIASFARSPKPSIIRLGKASM